MKIVAAIIFLLSASLYSAGQLTREELTKKASHICSGQITATKADAKCLNASCRNRETKFTVTLTTDSCEKNHAESLTADFFENIYVEGNNPQPFYGHYPQPELGQKGTIYVHDGKLLYPNGWLAR